MGAAVDAWLSVDRGILVPQRPGERRHWTRYRRVFVQSPRCHLEEYEAERFGKQPTRVLFPQPFVLTIAKRCHYRGESFVRGTIMRRNISVLAVVVLVGVVTFVMLRAGGPKSGEIKDEAMLANRSVSSFPAADEDYFAAMDNGAKLNVEEVKGRDMWLVWSGGNDRFWDELIKDSFGTFDLLKTISSALSALIRPRTL